MSTMSERLVIAAALGLICLAPAAEAQTQPPQVTELPRTDVNSPGLPVVRVSYADLDIGSEAGMQTFATRVRSAARRVCQPGKHRPDLDELLGCRRQARREAWQQFDRNQELARASGNPVVAAIAIRPVAY